MSELMKMSGEEEQETSQKITFTAEAFIRMIGSLSNTFGSAGGSMMFQMGKDVGSYEARKILQELEDSEAEPEALMEKILEEVSGHGWGELRLEEFDLVEGVVEVVLQHNVFEAHCEEIDMPQCFFLRGYLAGIIEELTEQRLHFKESRCYALGDKDCSIKMVKS